MDKEKQQDNQRTTDVARRSFIKKMAIGGIAVASTAAISKKVTSISAKDSLDKAQLRDEMQQDKAMAGKEYILMSQEEKRDFIEKVVNSYKYDEQV